MRKGVSPPLEKGRKGGFPRWKAFLRKSPSIPLFQRGRVLTSFVVVGLAMLNTGCRQDMHDQPKFQPFEGSSFFKDGRSARPPIDGTVARGQLDEDPVFFAGRMENGAFSDHIPVAVDRTLLDRGRERFNIYCSPCHDRAGSGRGMIVERGFKQPTSFHTERLRSLPPGYLFGVINNGFGVMPSYAAQVPPADCWAIVAYVRALQRSQHTVIADVPESERGSLGAP